MPASFFVSIFVLKFFIKSKISRHQENLPRYYYSISIRLFR